VTRVRLPSSRSLSLSLPLSLSLSLLFSPFLPLCTVAFARGHPRRIGPVRSRRTLPFLSFSCSLDASPDASAHPPILSRRFMAILNFDGCVKRYQAVPPLPRRLAGDTERLLLPGSYQRSARLSRGKSRERSSISFLAVRSSLSPSLSYPPSIFFPPFTAERNCATETERECTRR